MDRVEMVGKASESWNRYVDAHGEEFPGLRNVRSPEELNSFFSSHPEASVLKDQTPSSVFDDLRYASSTANVRNSEVASLVEASGSGVPKQEIPGTESFGHTLGGSAELLKDFFDRPPTMEDDLDYQGLRWSKEDEFKQKRRDLIDQAIADHAKEYKDKGANIHDLSDDDLLLLHPEGARYTHEAQLDYLYGSLDGKEAGIDTDTRDEFTRHMNEELEKKGPGFLGQREKLRRKKERWDKYDTSETGDVRRDPELRRFQFELEQARLGREDSEFAKWQLANPKGSWKQYHASSEYANFMDRMHQNSMNRYIKKHPKKALAYAKDAKTRLKNDPKATIHPHLKGITDAVDRHASFLQENLPDEYTEYTEFFSSPREKNQRSSFEPQERATGGNGASSFHYPTTGQGRQNNNNSLLGKANNKLNQVKNTAKNIKGLANDAKQIAELAQKLKYLNPYVLAAIGIATLIILIIVIIVAITDPSQNTNQTTTDKTVQRLSCNQPSSGNINLDMQNLGFKISGDIYGQGGLPSGLDPALVAQQKNDINQILYTTTCEIFQVNTFRNKIPISANNVIYIFNYAYGNKPDCSAEPLSTSSFQQPLTLFKLQNCTGNQQQFLIAQQLGKLIANGMTNEELNNFKDSISPDPALTIPNCQNGNIQTRACFADTIATFIVNNQASSSYGKSTFSGGRHGGWSVVTAGDARQAASLGVNYIMPYQFGPGTFSVDASTKFLDLGTDENTALVQSHMKTILDLHTLITCGGIDTGKITYLVTKYWQSSVLAGYWTRDDNPHCGLTKSLIQAYQLIHSIDKNPQHAVIPGFGETYNLRLDYAPGMADVLGFYPYPAFGTPPETEVASMLALVKSRTPAGQTPPPFIGLYQAYYTPGSLPRPLSDIKKDVQSFIDNGAISVAAFGWREVDGGQYIVGDSTGQLANIVKGVSGYLSTH